MIPKPGYVRRLIMTRIRPRKATLRPDELQAVLTHYDLGHWEVSRSLGGTSSHNLLLQTSQGKKILKRYRWSLPSTMQEHSVLRHLAGTNFPTPRLAINREGLTFTVVGNRHYAIYDFIDGYSCTDYFLPANTRQRLVAEAGKMLARLHQLTTGFTPEGRKFNGFMPDGERLWRDVTWHINVLDHYVEIIRKKRLPDRRDTFVLSIIDQLRHDLVEVGHCFEQSALEFPKLVIHGDYAPHNVLFDRTGVVAVLDFGDSCVNLRALDIARGLTSFSGANRSRDSNHLNIDKSLAGNFLQAYQAQHPLSDDEVAAVPDLIRWRLFQSLIWKLDRSDSSHETSRTHLETLRHHWKITCWIKAHRDELRASLLSMNRN